MKNSIRATLITATLASSLFLGSCKTQEEYVAAKPGAVVEQRGTPPDAGAVWIGTEYRWEPATKTYVVVHGHWEHPTHGGAAWVPGHWRHVTHGYAWVPGHWK